jgi:hypothetical protein
MNKEKKKKKQPTRVENKNKWREKKHTYTQ